MQSCWKNNKNKTFYYFKNVSFFDDNSDIDIVFKMLVYNLIANLIL